ncbi:MAG: hypothetical protein U0457_08050 [Candidatus Sericytochromatia bacterium]
MIKILLSASLMLIIVSCSQQGVKNNSIDLANETKIESNAGFNSALKDTIKQYFGIADKNNDSFVDLSESSDFFGSNHVEEIMKKVDKNNDKKISLDESLSTDWFKIFNYDKNMFRKLLLSGNLKDIFTCNEKLVCTGFATKKDYMIFLGVNTNTPKTVIEQYNISFYLGDKNKDEKLSFSELEDIGYANSKSHLNVYTPTNQPQPIPSGNPFTL